MVIVDANTGEVLASEADLLHLPIDILANYLEYMIGNDISIEYVEI